MAEEFTAVNDVVRNGVRGCKDVQKDGAINDQAINLQLRVHLHFTSISTNLNKISDGREG